MATSTRQFKLEELQKTDRYLNYRNQLVLNNNLNLLGTPDFLLKMLPSPSFPCQFLFSAFIICKNGKAVFRIDRQEHIVESNTVLFLAPNCSVESIECSNTFQAAFIASTSNGFLNVDKKASLRMLRSHLLEPNVIRLDEFRITAGLTIISFIRKIILNPMEPLKDEALYGGFLLLSSMAARGLEENGNKALEEGRSSQKDIMSRFLSELNQRFREERSVAYYANFLCISPKHFAQVVHRKSGKHVKDWIRYFVIREAKKMLKSGNYTVQEVSHLLHFPNSSFFGKYFKAAVGCTPKEYTKAD